MRAGEDYAYVIDGIETPRPRLALAARTACAAARGVLDTDGVRLDRRRLRRARPRGHASSTSCTSARSRPRARSTPRSRTCAGAARARHHHDRADAGGGVPRPPRLGLRRRLPERRPVVLRRPARRSSGSSTPPTPRASRCCSTSSTTTSAPPGVQALEAFGPYFTRRATRRSGAGDELRRRRLRRASASGCCQSAEGWIRDFHLDGLRLDADPRDRRLQPRAPRRRRSRAACTRCDPRALVIAESGLNDPKVVRSHERGGWGCDAVWADDFHHALRVLLTGDRERLVRRVRRARAARQGVPPPARARRRLLDVPPPALRRAAPTTCRRSASSSSRPNHDQVGNRALGDRLPRRGAAARARSARCCHRSRRCSSRARSTASARRSSSSPTTSTRRSPTPRARAAGASSPPSPSSRRGGARSAGPRHVRALQAHPRGRARRACATSTRRCSRARRDRPAGEATTSTSTSTPAGCAVRRGEHSLLANFSRETVHVPRRARRRARARHAPRRRVEPGYVVLPPLSGALVR